MNNTEKILAEFVEEGADLEHNRWARWHKYSRLMATPAHIEMWDRKAEMPYIALTNEEQESDRKETRNYLPLLEKAIAQAIAEERDRVKELIEKIFENFPVNERGEVNPSEVVKFKKALKKCNDGYCDGTDGYSGPKNLKHLFDAEINPRCGKKLSSCSEGMGHVHG